MGMAVVGGVEEGTVGEVVLEVGVGLEADSGEEVMVAGGRLRLLVNLCFYIERGVKKECARFGIYNSRYTPMSLMHNLNTTLSSSHARESLFHFLPLYRLISQLISLRCAQPCSTWSAQLCFSPVGDISGSEG